MISRAKLQSQYKYDKNNTKQIMLKLNKTSDADIIQKLADVSNKQGYIKNLVRTDLKSYNNTLSKQDIQYLILPVAKKYDIKSIYLFGSYARGEATKKSDVDLLIDGGNYNGLFEFSELVSTFEKALDKHVDVITSSSLNNQTTNSSRKFKENILKDMVLLYERK